MLDLIKNQMFKATDKLKNTYVYRYDGEIKNNSFGNIKLWNLTMECETVVEAEWFNQRKIELL